jgi:hypothetical protein
VVAPASTVHVIMGSPYTNPSKEGTSSRGMVQRVPAYGQPPPAPRIIDEVYGCGWR